jgi:hypothetical protein
VREVAGDAAQAAAEGHGLELMRIAGRSSVASPGAAAALAPRERLPPRRTTRTSGSARASSAGWYVLERRCRRRPAANTSHARRERHPRAGARRVHSRRDRASGVVEQALEHREQRCARRASTCGPTRARGVRRRTRNTRSTSCGRRAGAGGKTTAAPTTARCSTSSAASATGTAPKRVDLPTPAAPQRLRGRGRGGHA